MGCENRKNSNGTRRARQGDSSNGFRAQRVCHLSPSFVRAELMMDRYQVATGSGDDTVRIWDLRALKTQYIIPAHRSSVSDLKFFRSTEELPHIPLEAPITNGTGNGEMDIDIDSHPNGKQNGGTTTDAAETLPKSGLFLVTAGFDCNVRIWSADEWTMIRNLPTDAGKVMSVDVSGDGKFIASASYSRSFHLFGPENAI